MPENTVYVGRGSKWGNPFTGKDAVNSYIQTIKFIKAGKLRDAVIQNKTWDYRWFTKKGLAELKGKNLACWCPLDKPCHADILLKLIGSMSLRG